MAHRANFNAQRYGKTVRWNFASTLPSTKNNLRANYLLQYWMARVFKFKEIKVFKVLFVIGGEFPVVKAIGYRRLLCKLPHGLSYPQFQTVVRSFKRFSGYNSFLPTMAEKIPVLASGVRFYKRSRRSSKYRKLMQYRKVARASYSRFRTHVAIITKGTSCAEQLTSLYLLEANSNLYRGIGMGDGVSGASSTDNDDDSNNTQNLTDTNENLAFDNNGPLEALSGSVSLQLVQTGQTCDMNYVLNLLRFLSDYDVLSLRPSIRSQSAALCAAVNGSLVDLAHIKNAATLTSSTGFGKFLLFNVWLAGFMRLYRSWKLAGRDDLVFFYSSQFDLAAEQSLLFKKHVRLVSLFFKFSRFDKFQDGSRTKKPFGSIAAQLLILKYVFKLMYFLRSSSLEGRSLPFEGQKNIPSGLACVVSHLYFIKKFTLLARRFKKFAPALLQGCRVRSFTRLLKFNRGIFFNFARGDSVYSLRYENYIILTRYAATVAVACIFLNGTGPDYRGDDEQFFSAYSAVRPDGSQSNPHVISNLGERMTWIRENSKRMLFRILSKLDASAVIRCGNQNDADLYLAAPSSINALVKNFDVTWGGTINKDYFARKKEEIRSVGGFYTRPYLYADDILDALYLPNPIDVKARKSGRRRLGFASSKFRKSVGLDEGTAADDVIKRFEWIRGRIIATANKMFFLAGDKETATLNGRPIVPLKLTKFARSAQKVFEKTLAATKWLEKSASGKMSSKAILRGSTRLFKFFLFFETVVRIAIGCESKSRARLWRNNPRQPYAHIFESWYPGGYVLDPELMGHNWFSYATTMFPFGAMDFAPSSPLHSAYKVRASRRFYDFNFFYEGDSALFFRAIGDLRALIRPFVKISTAFNAENKRQLEVGLMTKEEWIAIGGGSAAKNYSVISDYLLIGLTPLVHPNYKKKFWASQYERCYSYFTWVVDKNMTGRYYCDKLYTTWRWYVRLVPAISKELFFQILAVTRIGGSGRTFMPSQLLSSQFNYMDFDDYRCIMRGPLDRASVRLFGDVDKRAKKLLFLTFIDKFGLDADCFIRSTEPSLFSLASNFEVLYTFLSKLSIKLLSWKQKPHIVSDSLLSGDYSKASALVDLRTKNAFNRSVIDLPYYHSEDALRYKIFLLNMSMDFYKTFGVFYNVVFYPIARVFQSSEEMQLLAHRALYYLKTFVTPQNRALVWLNEFVLVYYASIYLKTSRPLVDFLAYRFKIEKKWGKPWNYALVVMQSLDLVKFGIHGIRIGFHGKFNGRDRAFRMYRVIGNNPCLRNGLLTGSYAARQCRARNGIVHFHIWLTYF